MLPKTVRARTLIQRLLSSSSTVAEIPTERKLVVPLAFHKTDAKIQPQQGKQKPPPIIMIHGSLASSNTYRSLVKRSDFAPSRDVFTLDMRNHGASPHVMEMSYTSMMNDVKRFMDDEGIQQACLVGHSMGGKISMQLALENPERVSELVVVDIAPITYDAVERQKRTTDEFSKASDPSVAIQAMRKVDFAKLRQKPDVEHALEKNGVHVERVRQFLMTNLVPDEHRPGHYRWRLNICAIADAFKSLQEFPPAESVPPTEFHGPSCFIRGALSPFVPDKSIDRIKSMFPKAQIVTIAAAAHWLQADKPGEFCQALNSFLPETSAPAIVQ